jgi:hypothetical protein
MTEEQPAWRNHCVNAWHFDVACIEDHGDYSRIAERMQTLAQGSLPIQNIRDHVDLESEIAWVELDYAGKTVHIDCKVEDDWVDVNIFGHFIELLAKSDPSKIYLYYDLHGQDCIVACVTKQQLAQLNTSGIVLFTLTYWYLNTPQRRESPRYRAYLGGLQREQLSPLYSDLCVSSRLSSLCHLLLSFWRRTA